MFIPIGSFENRNFYSSLLNVILNMLYYFKYFSGMVASTILARIGRAHFSSTKGKKADLWRLSRNYIKLHGLLRQRISEALKHTISLNLNGYFYINCREISHSVPSRAR